MGCCVAGGLWRHPRWSPFWVRSFVYTFCIFQLKRRIFLQKWLDHLLLMTSYLVAIETDFHQTCVKMCLRDMRTATENGRSR